MLSSACQGHTRSIKRVFVCSFESSWTTGLRALTSSMSCESQPPPLTASATDRIVKQVKTAEETTITISCCCQNASCPRVSSTRFFWIQRLLKTKKQNKKYFSPAAALTAVCVSLLVCVLRCILITNAPEGESLC